MSSKLENNYAQTSGTEDKPFVRFNTHQIPKQHNRWEIVNPSLRMPSEYFQAKADLKTGNVMGRYHNTQSKVPFNCPQELSTLHDTSNPRIPPFTTLDTHQDQTRLIKCKTSTPRIDNYPLDTISEQNIKRPPMIQSPIQQSVDSQIQDLDNTPKCKQHVLKKINLRSPT